MTVHIVQRGDTLWKISRQYGVSFDALKRVNGHLANPDYIVPGMSITIPEERGGKAQPPPAPKATEPSVRPTEKVAPEESESPRREPEKGPIPLPSLPSEQQPPKITTKKPQEDSTLKEPAQQKEPAQRPKPPVPVPEQMPPPYQFQPNQVPYIPVQPMFIPVPCGCMPIYDVDCAPTIPFQSNYPTNHHQLPSREETKQPTKPKQPQKEKSVAPSIVTPQLTPNVLYAPNIHDEGLGSKKQPSTPKQSTPHQPSQQQIPSAKPQKVPQFTPSQPTTEPSQTAKPQQPIQPSQPIQPQQPIWQQQGYQPQYSYPGGSYYMPLQQPNAYQNWQIAQFCTSCHQPVFPQRSFCSPMHSWSYGR